MQANVIEAILRREIVVGTLRSRFDDDDAAGKVRLLIENFDDPFDKGTQKIAATELNNTTEAVSDFFKLGSSF